MRAFSGVIRVARAHAHFGGCPGLRFAWVPARLARGSARSPSPVWRVGSERMWHPARGGTRALREFIRFHMGGVAARRRQCPPPAVAQPLIVSCSLT